MEGCPIAWVYASLPYGVRVAHVVCRCVTGSKRSTWPGQRSRNMPPLVCADRDLMAAFEMNSSDFFPQLPQCQALGSWTSQTGYKLQFFEVFDRRQLVILVCQVTSRQWFCTGSRPSLRCSKAGRNLHREEVQRME